jgi:putative phosphoribosyl transferase
MVSNTKHQRCGFASILFKTLTKKAMFKDRFDAGRQLAKKLRHYKNRDGVILAVPRGGVEVGYVVAKELCLPLEVVLSKKIGHPINAEFAIGSVSLEGLVFSKRPDVSDDYINKEVVRLRQLLRERYKKYCGDRKPTSLEGKIVIIVDDGIATGNTLLSTVELVRKYHPERVMVAIPVAPQDSLNNVCLADGVDEVVCLLTPNNFYAVGQFYENFDQVEDDEVTRLLQEVWQSKQKSGHTKQLQNQ